MDTYSIDASSHLTPVCRENSSFRYFDESSLAVVCRGGGGRVFFGGKFCTTCFAFRILVDEAGILGGFVGFEVFSGILLDDIVLSSFAEIVVDEGNRSMSGSDDGRLFDETDLFDFGVDGNGDELIEVDFEEEEFRATGMGEGSLKVDMEGFLCGAGRGDLCDTVEFILDDVANGSMLGLSRSDSNDANAI